jgi:type VI secretion system secreted protein Hcp
MRPNLIRTLAVTLCLAGATPALAGEILVTAQGMKQGNIVGNGPGGKILATKFSYEVTSPRDAATGQASGKRQHKPVTITKEWGAASPQLYQALLTNELLSTVVLEFQGTNQKGMTETAHYIRLSNATVTDIKRYTSSTGAELEDVSFTFEVIEIQDAGGTLVRDDWTL